LDVYPDKPYTTGRSCDIKCLGDDEIFDILAAAINYLEPNAITCYINTIWLELQNLSHRVVVLEVDWNSTDDFAFASLSGT
jgi:hypothetical protein